MKICTFLSGIFTAAALMTAVFPVSAQSSGFRYGVKGGMNFSSVSHFEVGNIDESVNRYTAFNAGVAFQIKLPIRGMVLQPELLYVAKGARFSGKYDTFVKINYLELPINFQAGLDLILFRPFLQVSPYIGYALSTDSALFEMDRFEYGIGVGGGIDVWRMQLNVRYCWNLGVLSKEFTPQGAIDPDTAEVINSIIDGRLRGLEISLAFFF